MSVVTCWLSWVLAGWSEMISAGASCLCSMNSLIPHQDSLGFLNWWLLLGEQSPAQYWHIVTSATLCFPNQVTGAAQTQRKDREIAPVDYRSFQTTLQRMWLEWGEDIWGHFYKQSATPKQLHSYPVKYAIILKLCAFYFYQSQ